MRQNFAAYSSKGGIKNPDSNIDHYCMPNIVTQDIIIIVYRAIENYYML